MAGEWDLDGGSDSGADHAPRRRPMVVVKAPAGEAVVPAPAGQAVIPTPAGEAVVPAPAGQAVIPTPAGEVVVEVDQEIVDDEAR